MKKSTGAPPSIADIATAAGVSLATVSRVINDSGKVSEDVASRVRETIAALGYTRIRRAKVSTGLTRFVGLAIPDIENPYFSSLIRGVQSVASSHERDFVLMDSAADIDQLRKSIVQLSKRGMEILLYVPSEETREATLQIADLGIPVVFMDRCPDLPEANYVGSENRLGAYNAARYLLSLGHRRILYLAGLESLNTERERREGFMEALIQDSIDPKDCLIKACDFSLEKAHATLRALLRGRTDFTAIFATDDYMAYGALNAIHERGLRVPEDISLVGFDDIPYSSMISLTTVSQPAYQIGANSMLLALDLLSGRKTAPQRIILPTSLIIRGSCALPRAAKEEGEDRPWAKKEGI